jgi:hypothetical protein
MRVDLDGYRKFCDMGRKNGLNWFPQKKNKTIINQNKIQIAQHNI